MYTKYKNNRTPSKNKTKKKTRKMTGSHVKQKSRDKSCEIFTCYVKQTYCESLTDETSERKSEIADSLKASPKEVR